MQHLLSARQAAGAASRLNSIARLTVATAALGALALTPARAVTVTGPLWTKSMLNNQYQLYAVNFCQAASSGGNVAQVTWPKAAVPAWVGISAYDDSKDDCASGCLASGKMSFAPSDPCMNTVAAVPNCGTAIIKVRNLSSFAMNPAIQWFTLSANVASMTWVAPATFGRVAGGIVWSSGNTQGTVNLLNTGGVTAHDVTLTILNASRQPISGPVAVVSAVGPRGALALHFSVPSGVHVGTQLYLQLNFHAAGEAGTSAFAVYVGQ